jgi:hypothetical protein
VVARMETSVCPPRQPPSIWLYAILPFVLREVDERGHTQLKQVGKAGAVQARIPTRAGMLAPEQTWVIHGEPTRRGGGQHEARLSPRSAAAAAVTEQAA